MYETLKTDCFIYRGHMMPRPPSTGRVTPVIKEASSEARKAIALATCGISKVQYNLSICLCI